MSQTKAQLLAPIGIITCPGLDVTVGGSSPFQVGSTGIITAVSASFSGNVTVGGTLTYDDVTNIDSVGLITARSGVDITGASAGVNGSSNLILKTGGNEKVRITSAGNFGIGDPNPDSLLHIGKGTNADDGAVTFTIGGSSVNTRQSTITKNNVGANDRALEFHAATGTSHESIKFFSHATSERLRIGQSGQIGLGGANYGTDGQVLTSKGTGAAPQWEAAGGGIGEIDQWYLTANKLIAGGSTTALMSSDLTRAGTANGNFAAKGTGMTYASGTGIWTFPSTGYWQLGYTLIGDGVAEGNYIHYGWQLTTNNSTYTETIQNGTEHIGNGNYYWQVSGTNMFRITDVSNQKVKFFFRHSGGGNLDLFGGNQTGSPTANDYLASGWTFVKLSGV